MSSNLDIFKSANPARVLAVGTTCAGKTTHARQLSRFLQTPHIELDELYWLADWIERPEEEFRTAVGKAAARNSWVMDGNFGSVREVIWPRATAVVWLNYSFLTVGWRGLRRTVKRCVRKEELYGGNRETISKAFFSRDSILWWLATTYGRLKREYRNIFDQDTYPNLTKIELKSPLEAEKLLTARRLRLLNLPRSVIDRLCRRLIGDRPKFAGRCPGLPRHRPAPTRLPDGRGGRRAPRLRLRGPWWPSRRALAVDQRRSVSRGCMARSSAPSVWASSQLGRRRCGQVADPISAPGIDIGLLDPLEVALRGAQIRLGLVRAGKCAAEAMFLRNPRTEGQPASSAAILLGVRLHRGTDFNRRGEICTQPIDPLVVSIAAKGQSQIFGHAEVRTGNHGYVGLLENIPRQLL